MWSWTYYVDHAGLENTEVCLPPRRWDWRCAPLYLVHYTLMCVCLCVLVSLCEQCEHRAARGQKWPWIPSNCSESPNLWAISTALKRPFKVTSSTLYVTMKIMHNIKSTKFSIHFSSFQLIHRAACLLFPLELLLPIKLRLHKTPMRQLFPSDAPLPDIILLLFF